MFVAAVKLKFSNLYHENLELETEEWQSIFQRTVFTFVGMVAFVEVVVVRTFTAQKMKFSIKDFFSNCDQLYRNLRIWSHLLQKSLIKNLIFCACSVYTSLHETLTLWSTISQNGQTYFKNLAVFSTKFLKCFWLFWNIMQELNLIITSSFGYLLDLLCYILLF